MTSRPFVIESTAGEPIRGDVHQPEGLLQTSTVVLVHGFKGFKDWGFMPYLAEQICNAGFTAVRFNTSRNGVGEGGERFEDLERFAENTIAQELDDIRSVLTEISENTTGLFDDVYPEAIGLLGHSRGGATAILSAVGDPRVLTVVGWAAVAHFDRFGDREEEWAREGRIAITNARTGQEMPLNRSILDDIRQNAERYDIPRAASRLDAPLLLVHAQDDETVSIEEAERIYAQSDQMVSSLYRLAEGGHAFGASHPFSGSAQPLENALISTLDWLERHLNV